MSKASRKWSEVRTISDMSSQQWKSFQARLKKLDSSGWERLRTEFGFNKRSLDNIVNLRDRKNRPRSLPTALGKRLQELLKHLGLTDGLYAASTSRVYLAPPGRSGDDIPYVGRGDDDRMTRYTGHTLDTLEPLDGFHVECLEGLLLWFARVARFQPDNRKHPSVCPSCEKGYSTLAEQVRNRIGLKITRSEFLQSAAVVAVVSRYDL